MGKPQILSDTKLPPSQMFDVRNADGQIVHVNIEDINQFLSYHEVFGKIGGNTEHTFPPAASAIPPPINPTVPVSNAQTTPIPPPTTINQTQQSQTQSTTPLVIPKIENINTSVASNSNPISVSTTTNVTNNTSTATCATPGGSDDSSTMPSPGMHTCDICGKVFAFKYQFIGKIKIHIYF